LTVGDHVSSRILPAEAPRHPGRGRLSARLVLAVAISGALCEVVWRFVPRQLSVTTDIVGYPIFAHWNPNRYFDAFYLIAIVFPLGAVLLFTYLPLWRPSPRNPRTLIRPLLLVERDETGAEPGTETADEEGRSSWVTGAGRVARIALPAFAVGVCVGVVGSGDGPHLSAWGWLAGALYGAVVVVGGRWWQRRRPDVDRARILAAINGGVALVVIVALYFVSRSSSVLVSSDHHLRHFPWLPLWLMIPVLAVVAWWYRRRLGRANSTGDVRDAEAAVLTYVVGSALLLVLIARLAGPLDLTFGAFDQAQSLASAQLTFGHGLFPWRDLYVIHGVYGDILSGQLGMSVFEASRWGSASGFTIFLIPLLWVSMYVFTAYFARRNRLVAAALVAVAALWLTGGRLGGGGLLLSPDVTKYAQGFFRFAFLPVVLILFDQTIRRRSRGWCAGFMAALVAQAILVPETALMAAGILLTLVAFEWLGRARGGDWARSLMRTWWCAAFGALFVVAWVIFLVATGSLRGFVDYYVIFGPGHTLSGAEPGWWIGHQLGPTVEFVLPVVLLVLTFLRVTVQIRQRRAWDPRDWVMVAAATFVLFYFQKVLARADQAHTAEVFTVTLPLLLLWVITAAQALDGAWRRFVVGRLRRAGARSVRGALVAVRHPVTLVMVLALVVIAPSPFGTLNAVAAGYHVTTKSEPALAALGYSEPGVIDVTMVHDLDAVLRRYAGATGPVFDFNDEPGLLYYLLNRVPGTSFFHVSEADTGFAQRQLISDLKRSRPRLIVFYGQGIGLPSWDGIEAMVRHYDVSDYLLDNYLPLANVDGQFVMIRADLAASAPPLPALAGTASTQNFYLSLPQCDWGFAPDFLARPASLATQPGLRLASQVVSDTTEFIGGWTSGRHKGQAPLDVVAVRDGKVIATVVPNNYHTSASPDTGFTVSIPVTTGAGPVALYALNPDGTVSALAPEASVPAGLVTAGADRTVTTSDGTSHAVSPGSGGVVGTATVGPQSTVSLDVPAGTNLSSYHWIELSAPKGVGGARYSVTDGLDQSPQVINFNTLPRVGAHYFVQIGSCPQWRGFSAPGLSLVQDGGPKSTPAVRLVR
jgi:hypothetical protein